MESDDGKQVGLVGSFFHTVKDGNLEWQGYVVENPEPGWYLVQLYEWLMGDESHRTLVRIETMQDWMFYANSDAMNFSFKYGSARKYAREADNAE
jgi:hypothetical protein